MVVLFRVICYWEEHGQTAKVYDIITNILPWSEAHIYRTMLKKHIKVDNKNELGFEQTG